MGATHMGATHMGATHMGATHMGATHMGATHMGEQRGGACVREGEGGGACVVYEFVCVCDCLFCVRLCVRVCLSVRVVLAQCLVAHLDPSVFPPRSNKHRIVMTQHLVRDENS